MTTVSILVLYNETMREIVEIPERLLMEIVLKLNLIEHWSKGNVKFHKFNTKFNEWTPIIELSDWMLVQDKERIRVTINGTLSVTAASSSTHTEQNTFFVEDTLDTNSFLPSGSTEPSIPETQLAPEDVTLNNGEERKGWPSTFSIDETFFRFSMVRYLNTGKPMRAGDRNGVIDGMFELMNTFVERPTPDQYRQAATSLIDKWDVKEGRSPEDAVVISLNLS